MKTLKPFSLEAAIAGEPIQTRDGRKARFLAHVPEFEKSRRVLVAVENDGGVCSNFETGQFYIEEENPRDLFMAPKTYYVNLYRGGWDKFDTAEEAKENATAAALAIAIPVEISE